MLTRTDVERFFTAGIRGYLPHLSVDCVVFGFHDGELRVLLLKWKGADLWTLPGGYVKRLEPVDVAAARVLRARTGLGRLYLQQFRTFGGVGRHERDLGTLLRSLGIPAPADAWPLARVVSVGYLALVDFTKARPRADYLSEACEWRPVTRLPRLAFDHRAIVRAALAALRERVEDPRLAASLLPSRFTMPELRRLHEGILGTPLDRRNFQKVMLDRGLVERLNERRRGGAHRSPYLYRFVG